MLAFSFLAAIRQASRFNFPIIVDTAFARISSEPRVNFSRFLPTAFKGSQVILLLTDTEYTSPCFIFT